MFIGIDESGVVRLQCADREGISDDLQAVELTAEQVSEYQSLPMPVEKVIYQNGVFSTVPPAVSAAALDAIQKIEGANPFTHRSLREFFIAIAEVYPASKTTTMYKRAKAADDAIRLERAKL